MAARELEQERTRLLPAGTGVIYSATGCKMGRDDSAREEGGEA